MRGFDWSRRTRFWWDFATTLPSVIGPSCALWLAILIYQGRELVYIP
jgi:hypothetical protein